MDEAEHDLAVVVPVYNEEANVEALVKRCHETCQRLQLAYQLILVDDASTDKTAVNLIRLQERYPIEILRLTKNRGQFGATQAGLVQAHADVVIVLDGDLQDPPEVIEDLVADYQETGRDIVFAVKASRQDAPLFRWLHFLYSLLQRFFASDPYPVGAGSYCLMRRPLSKAVSTISFQHANLAPLLALMNVPYSVVPYQKEARKEGQSMPYRDLLREAFGSLILSGAATRVFTFLFFLSALGAFALDVFALFRMCCLLLMIFSAFTGTRCWFLRYGVKEEMSQNNL